MRLYYSLFLSILTAFAPLIKRAILYDMCNVQLQLYAKGLITVLTCSSFNQ